MDVVWAVAVVVAFAVTIERLGLPDRAREVGRRSRACLEVLGDPARDDDAKETALRREALRLFRLFGLLLGGSLLALGLPLGAVWGLDLVGLASLSDVLATLERVDFLAAVTVAGLAAYLVIRRVGRS